MAIIGIAHEYGPWGPVHFLLLPSFLHSEDAPTFYVTTTRMCKGIHDWRCTASETQTFGPLVLAGKTQEELFRCDNCSRIQPPPDTAVMDQKVQCLFCSDMATVQHTAADVDSAAAVSAVAALSAASGVLRHTKEADPDGYVALLDDTGDELRSVLDDAAWAVRQDPRRAGQTGYGHLTLIARQIVANARGYAELHTENHPVDSPAVPEGTE